MIYLDNGATSFPKPREVIESVVTAMNEYCANPGRSGHDMAMRTAREIYRTRTAAAELFNISEPERIIFTKNCTEALNLGLKGILREGAHVITSSMEHNSVIRPLHALERKGVETTVIKCRTDGSLPLDAVKGAIRKNTAMIVLTAASNVTGTKMPLAEVGRMARRRGILFMVDGAQGAGHMRIDVKEQNIDVLAASGHKGLMGPQGTGLLYVREGIELSTQIEGGTGSKSKEVSQPKDSPEGYEAGTLNSPGIIGLGAAIALIEKIGIDVIAAHEMRMAERLREMLRNIPGVMIYGPQDANKRTAVVAVNIEGEDSEKIALQLNDEYGIAVRAGFHCSPLAHKTIGTERSGCIRICPGFYTGERDIARTAEAFMEICADKARRRL